MKTRAHHRCCISAYQFTASVRRDEGVGLAAPQVGVNVRLMVYNPEGKRGEGREWILVNPRIISSSKGSDVMEEGCLSFQDQSKDLYIRGDVRVSSQAVVLPGKHAMSYHQQRCEAEHEVPQRLHTPPALHCTNPLPCLQRSNTVKVKAQDENGAKVSLTLSDDWQARIFQHEYDHI